MIRILYFLLVLLAGCRTPSSAPPLQRYDFTQPQMGIPFRLVFYAASEAHAHRAAEAAFARVAELNAIFSDYDSDSELSRLSRTSGQHRSMPVSRELWDVLVQSQKLAAETAGAFDITVGPLVNLWRKARRDRQLPRSDLFDDARRRVGYRYVVLHPGTRQVELTIPEMRLDAAAMAKGYAIDSALAVLRRHGIQRALVTGGGDMAFGKAPPGKKGWRIELAPLDATNAPPARFLSLATCALGTSGDMFQRLEIGGKRYSHIIDPRTGLGLEDHSVVRVIAHDCQTANSLATATSVVGPEAGLALVKKRGAEAHIVRKPAQQIEVMESPGFKRFDQR